MKTLQAIHAWRGRGDESRVYMTMVLLLFIFAETVRSGDLRRRFAGGRSARPLRL